MIDLQNILRMVKANENDKPRYGNLVKSQDGERSNAARHKALVASSRNGGITLDGLFKTRAGFEEWISKFPEGIIDPKHGVDVFDELLTTNAAIIDSVSLARVREIQDVFRRYAENNTIMKQIPASQLDRETLKQQYFNNLKGNS